MMMAAMVVMVRVVVVATTGVTNGRGIDDGGVSE